MNARSNVVDGMATDETSGDFETVFHAHYDRIARAIARVTGDPARAEELAVEVFWKLWRNPQAMGEKAGAWLYRTAVRTGLNELRHRVRRARYERLSDGAARSPTPEEAHASAEEQEHVRRVLASMDRRQAELLLLRGSGLKYEEVAAALNLNPAGVGTLISRAQQAFRKEYVKRYGQQ
ncbi:MAG TPA: sigma-70 family RNA polymerase sigma factor [Candidatus Acidoferrales bacterium]|nr:sigma-70 family RNA polymerase sigma factor [Candidatus Acidoferrales bacterium]